MSFTFSKIIGSCQSAETKAEEGGERGMGLSGYGLTNNDKVDQFAEALVGRKPLCQATQVLHPVQARHTAEGKKGKLCAFQRS